MAFNLPDLCLRKIFKFLANDKNEAYLLRRKNLHSCTLTNRYWCKMSIPFLWREPFTGSLSSIKSTILVNVLISNFPKEELRILNINSISSYDRTSFNYITFIRTLIVNAVIEATTYWLQNNSTISRESSIANSLLKQILLHASNLKHIISNSDINIFQFPVSKNCFSNLTELTGFDERVSGIYSSVANVAENIQILRFSLTNSHVVNPTTVNDIARIIERQKNLERFSVDNRFSCYCCPQDLFSLNFTRVFDALMTQFESLYYIGLYDIDFFSNFPFKQLTSCKNLGHLEITRCYNFGDVNFDQVDSTFSLTRITIYYSAIPSHILKIFFSQSERSLRKVKLVGNEVVGNFHDLIQDCIIYNPNLTHFLSYVHSREIYLLPKFFKSCQFLRHFEIWDLNYLSNDTNNRLGEMIDADELLMDISKSMPSTLTIFNIIMNWSFSSNSFEIFLKNLERSNVRLDYLGFPFCSRFTNDHLETIINHLKFPLKWLNIRNANNIQVKRSTKIKKLVVPNNVSCVVEYDKYFFDIINQTSF